MVLIILIILIIGIYLISLSLLQMDKLAKFRETLKTGDKVFYLNRTSNKYYEATIVKVYRHFSYDTLWVIKVEEEDDTAITSELNLFNKKYYFG